MFGTIDSSQLVQIVGGVSPEHAVACIGSYMGTQPDGSKGRDPVDARSRDFIGNLQSPSRRVRERARGGFSGMQAAIADHASGIHGEEMALRRCGTRPAF
jgi:hypothetical protein